MTIKRVIDVPCVICGAKPGEPCRNRNIVYMGLGGEPSHTERAIDFTLKKRQEAEIKNAKRK